MGWLSIGIFFMLTIACDDDNDNKGSDTTEVGEYKLLTLVANADGNTHAYYLQAMSDINITGEVDNSNATELQAASAAGAYAYDGDFYLNDYYASVEISKWTVNSSGGFDNQGSVSTTDLGYAGNMLVVDETTAFVGGSNTFKVAIFNPTTMVRTGYIDLSEYSKIDEVTDYPTEGATVQSEAVAEVIVRGDYMFVAVYYFDSFSTYNPNLDGCYIIVVDLTQVDPTSSSNADAVVKEISDDRGSYTGAWNSGVGSNFMILDENNDLYVMCHNMWGGARETTGKPACVLRINDGETEFDSDYYYDLESTSQGSGNPVMGLEYHQNGKFYATVMDPSQIDADNPYSYYSDPIFKWWQFDLYNPEDNASIIDTDTYCKGSAATNCFFEGDYAYIPFDNDTDSYVLRVTTSTLEQDVLFSTNGIPFLFKDN